MRVERRMMPPILVTLTILLASCAGTTHKDSSPPEGWEKEASSVEILYTRGHNEHRLFAELQGEAAIAQSFLDRQLLAKSSVDRVKYLGFLRKASEFVAGPHHAAADRFPCRAPFTITVRIGSESRAASGCFSSDEGALSHLVRDGEFLLHQGSGMRIK